MQRHNDTTKPLPETQERGTQNHPDRDTCEFRTAGLISTLAGEPP